MALLKLLIFTTIFTKALSEVSIKANLIDPLTCSVEKNQTCNSSLYRISQGLTIDQIASYYKVNPSQLKPFHRGSKDDYLVSVPCGCKNVNGTIGYFYDVSYNVLANDTFEKVSNDIFGGQAWMVENGYLGVGIVPFHLVCGCVQGDSEVVVVVTYTVQEQDTLSEIASLLSAKMDRIQDLNGELAKNPNAINPGEVFLIPMEKNGIPPLKGGKQHQTWHIIIGILSAVTILSMGTLFIILLRRRRTRELSDEEQKAVSKTLSSRRTQSLQSQYGSQDMTGFDSERPTIYSLDEIEEATANFHETRKIGEGGYGSVYFGKMKSNKSKEFFAELKVLCKIHHKNVVELLGYASGDDHLYLVYEYVQNGALSDHLHDPLLKGHQPLSWTARAQIALDTARGIEYIHDHTKAHYVHRDIKTSNILLDEGLRAKVADFGLVKLVERSNEDDCIATRLVGTPGYLPPESVRELQTSSKADVFAFGVVLAELITGQRALIRDNQEPSKMKALISVVYKLFQEEDPENALEAIIDGSLKDVYPMEEVYKMAEISEWCLSEDAVNRPEMQEIVVTLSQILVSSIEWEASLGGSSQVFSGVFNGR
ncbi:hypothetical protein ACHQM5_008135 [Ranunculus cassubicifolius]